MIVVNNVNAQLLMGVGNATLAAQVAIPCLGVWPSVGATLKAAAGANGTLHAKWPLDSALDSVRWGGGRPFVPARDGVGRAHARLHLLPRKKSPMWRIPAMAR